MTQDILGCDDSVAEQDDFKKRAEQASEKWLRDNDWDYQKYCDRRQDRSAYNTLMNYEISGVLAQAFEDGALWARSNLDAEGLVTMSREQWEGNKTYYYREGVRDAVGEFILLAMEWNNSGASDRVFAATSLILKCAKVREALRGSGEK